MTVRDELEYLVEYGKTRGGNEDFAECAYAFLRDHGTALLEALEDAERYRWLRVNLQHVSFGELSCDTSDIGLDQAIDTARRGGG